MKKRPIWLKDLKFLRAVYDVRIAKDLGMVLELIHQIHMVMNVQYLDKGAWNRLDELADNNTSDYGHI